MKSIIKLSIFTSVFLFMSSCSNNNDDSFTEKSEVNQNYLLRENNKELDLTNLVIKKEVMNNIVTEISLIKANINNVEEEQVKSILNPLLENGKILHSEMLSFLERNGELQNLNSSEIEEITNLTDEQLIELSFITYNQSRYATSSIDWPRVRSCASFALGIQGIKTLYTNTLALGTVETMVGALKLIGKRYLGYIGIALMIYDFMDCIYGD